VGVEELDTFVRNRFRDCVYIVTAHEEHEDGTPHRHVLVKYQTRHDCRTTTFDFEGHHPNVQRPQNWNASENYVKKDGQFIEWRDDEVQLSNVFDVARRSSYETFVIHCLNNNISAGWGRMVWDYVTQPLIVPIYDEDPNPELNLPLQRSLSELAFTPEDRTTYLVNGPPGIGKTVAVLRLVPKPVMLVSHIDQLKELTSKVKSVVFDDCSFLHLPRTGQLAICDRYLPHAIHRRYGTSMIPSGTLVVMTSNVLPVDVDDTAIARRCTIIHV